ncbi:MAG: small subunit ribosomal protein [Verrucomicrobiota bacterium]|jgi:small subunit ribosomal protein S16
MAVSIRLRREGAKNRPYYKVVVADSRSPRDGKFIELIGTYDPKKPDHNSTLKLDRIDHWISKGAQPSDTVRSLIKKNKKNATGATPEVAAPKPAPEATAPEPAPEAAAPAEPTAAAEPTVAVEPPATPAAE